MKEQDYPADGATMIAALAALGRRSAVRGVGAGLAALVAPALAPPTRSQPHPAAVAGPVMAASAFLDGVGVGAHWEYKNTVYGTHTAELVRALAGSGIRHVRGYDPAISRALAEHGLMSTLVAGPEVGSPEQIADMVEAVNRPVRIVDAVEGPNEADLFWVNNRYTFEGNGFPAGVLAYQRALYRAFKRRPATAGTLVIGPSLGGTYDPAAGRPNPLPPGSLTDAVDLGNFHPYPFGGNSFSIPFRYGGIERYYWNGNFPSANLDEFPYNTTVYAPPFAPKPMAATETGYYTGPEGVSEAVQARYIPRLFAEYARLGIRRTYLYELADVTTVQGKEAHFGLLRGDATPKPAFTALSSLLRLIAADSRGRIGAVAPDFTIELDMPLSYDRSQYVHSLLLLKPLSRALLLLWHEVASADTSEMPPREINVPAGEVTIVLTPGTSATSWYDYDPDWTLRHSNADARSDRLTIPLRDQVVAVALETRA